MQTCSSLRETCILLVVPRHSGIQEVVLDIHPPSSHCLTVICLCTVISRQISISPRRMALGMGNCKLMNIEDYFL
ncbi:hypothetical protein GDO78_000173 [Eleutherodactylus coqui]|uniref:Uncharacterized protein n=1 Tax=Eleutherodactylus coqui TaxID=57060 RepID=A0A8J6KGN9_ELECQ|nr:hypothetical protein GDO78_000173 [Eleutherodactylus coqui]